MKALIFHAGALGDLVNTLPAIAALRRRFPDATITAVGRTDLLALPLASGLIDEAVSLERPGFNLLFGSAAPGEEMHPSAREWLSGFDLAVSWIRSPELIANLSALCLQAHVHPGPFPPPAGSTHITDHMMLAIRGLGIDEPGSAPRLPEPPGGWPGPRFPGILVHPGSGSRDKNWPTERFARCALLLARATGLPIGVLQGPADGESATEVAARLRSAGAGGLAFTGLSLSELAGLLASARLVLANDSGVAHLAGAVGAPVVAVYGPSNPRVWGVRQERAVNIRDSDCPPCFGERRECASPKCLTDTPAEEVAEAAEELLSRR